MSQLELFKCNNDGACTEDKQMCLFLAALGDNDISYVMENLPNVHQYAVKTEKSNKIWYFNKSCGRLVSVIK